MIWLQPYHIYGAYHFEKGLINTQNVLQALSLEFRFLEPVLPELGAQLAARDPRLSRGKKYSTKKTKKNTLTTQAERQDIMRRKKNPLT